MIKIATWNINSIRSRMDNIEKWVHDHNPDIILLQETKCIDTCFPEVSITAMGYNAVCVGQKSYNGVAIISKQPIQVESKALPPLEGIQDDLEARYLEAICEVKGKVLRIISVYVPNGGSALLKGEKLEDSKRFIYKLNFLKRLQHRFNHLKQFNEYVIAGGDYNVARSELDLYNPKDAEGDVGFHIDERLHLDNVLKTGYYDVFRDLYPEKVEYSWWDYRRNGWAMNKGWRIDYMLCSENLKSYIAKCNIHSYTRGWNKASDHVPVEIIIE